MSHTPHAASGFSLLELTVTLSILALLAATLLPSLASQRDLAAQLEARRQLETGREALLAFAMVNGRLPCPARGNLPSQAAQAGQEDCSLSDGQGVLPWASLALPENDPHGQRLTYFAQSEFTAPLPAGSLCAFSLDTPGKANVKARSGAGENLASALPAILVAHGQRGAGAWLSDGRQLAGAGGDEAENADGDLEFVARDPSPDFDDQLVWISAAILKARLIAAGRLP